MHKFLTVFVIIIKILFTETLSCWVYLLVKAKDEMMDLPMINEYRFQPSLTEWCWAFVVIPKFLVGVFTGLPKNQNFLKVKGGSRSTICTKVRQINMILLYNLNHIQCNDLHKIIIIMKREERESLTNYYSDVKSWPSSWGLFSI